MTLAEIVKSGMGPSLLLNTIAHDLAKRKRTADAGLVITRPTRQGWGRYDAVDVTMLDKKYRITVKEVH